jgi:hypothetical protein
VDNHQRGLEVPRAIGLDRHLLAAAAPALAAADGALEALLALGRAPLALLSDPRARPPVPAPRPLAPRAARGARRRGLAWRVQGAEVHPVAGGLGRLARTLGGTAMARAMARSAPPFTVQLSVCSQL